MSFHGVENLRIGGHCAPPFLRFEQSRFICVVEIGGVVGDFVGQIDHLRFERRAEAGQIFVERGNFAGSEIAGVLHDAFAHLEGKIQSGEARITLLELIDDAERLNIVIEVVAVAPHLRVERILAGVGEGRMPDVVGQGEGFGEVLIESEGGGDGAGDLGDLDGVGETIAEMIGKAGGEDLGLGFQAAEGARVDDAVAIALEGVAVRMLGFRDSGGRGRPRPETAGARASALFLRQVPRGR